MAILLCCADPNLTHRWREGIGVLDTVCCIRNAAEIEQASADSALSLALIDLDAPGIDGLEAAVALCARYPQIAFLFFAGRPEAAEGVALIGAGGRGYCNRYIVPELLHKAVEVVALGEVWLGRRLVDHLLQKQASAVATQADAEKIESYASLTSREREVALLVANGASNKAVARRLGIVERTVKAHMSAIFGKTNTHDRLQLGLLVRSCQIEAVPARETGTKVQ